MKVFQCHLAGKPGDRLHTAPVHYAAPVGYPISIRSSGRNITVKQSCRDKRQGFFVQKQVLN